METIIKKHRVYIYIILFLIFGLYIDIKMTPKDQAICWGDYRQRTLNIQTVVPFHPERLTLYLGIGNKHWEFERSIINYVEKYTGQILERKVRDYGCSVPKDRTYYPKYKAGYINLRPFARILGEGTTETYENDEVVSFEEWNRWYR